MFVRQHLLDLVEHLIEDSEEADDDASDDNVYTDSIHVADSSRVAAQRQV